MQFPMVSGRRVSRRAALSVSLVSLLFAVPLWFAAGCGGSSSTTIGATPTPTGTATPTPIPSNRLLFASNLDTGHVGNQVYTIGADGSTPTRILSDGADDTPCAWSPDGTLILFSSNRDNSGGLINNRDMYTMHPDGTNIARLTNDTTRNSIFGSYSPDGSKIVFSRAGEIATMTASGANIVSITGSDLTHAINPVWSPDGTKIVFVADTPNATLQTDQSSSTIFVMATDGTNRVALTNGGEYIHQAAWSPDGKKLVFDSSADTGGIASLRTQIYVMNADGSNRVRLTNNTAQDVSPVWSPDGSLIIFSSNRDHGGGSGGTNPFDLYTMKPDGSSVTRLTTTGLSAFVPPGGWKK